MTRLFTGSFVRYSYLSPEDFPWEALESHCGKKFADKSRSEIFEAFRHIEHERALFDQSVQIGEIKRIQRSLLDACREIDRVIRAARHKDGHTSKYDALCAMLGGDAREHLDQLARTARLAGFALKEPRGRFVSVRDVRSPTRHLLREALRHLLEPVGPDGKARVETWGLSASRTSPRFRRFLEFLLDRDELTEGDLKKAMRDLRAPSEYEGEGP